METQFELELELKNCDSELRFRRGVIALRYGDAFTATATPDCHCCDARDDDDAPSRVFRAAATAEDGLQSSW